MYQAIKHMVPLHKILGLGMLQLYYEWTLLVKKMKAEEILKIRNINLEDGMSFIATKIDARKVTAKIQWLLFVHL